MMRDGDDGCSEEQVSSTGTDADGPRAHSEHLPWKVSTLVRKARGTLLACWEDPVYAVHFWDYPCHRPRRDGRVDVNLAGTLMAKTLGCGPKELWELTDFEVGAKHQLNAVISIQGARIFGALDHLKVLNTMMDWEDARFEEAHESLNAWKQDCERERPWERVRKEQTIEPFAQALENLANRAVAVGL